MMTPEQFPRLKKQTLVDDFINRFEEMILTGTLSIGEKLPSERDLAALLGVSRPVVHEGLIDLANKGLVTRSPSGGAVINDYRKDGSLPMLNSLLGFHNNLLEPNIARSTLEFRLLVEVENARLAARNRTPQQLAELQAILEQEQNLNGSAAQEIGQLDFAFHHLIAMATGNIFYPLLLNSFKELYLSFVARFYALPGVAQQVYAYHARLVEAIAARDEQTAAAVMTRMLEDGHQYMTDVILHLPQVGDLREVKTTPTDRPSHLPQVGNLREVKTTPTDPQPDKE
jgi:GntR family transcriptional repressor for pyruvate dehydrogenase complex